MSDASSETKFFTVREAERVVREITPMVEGMLDAFSKIRAEIESATASAGLRPSDPELAKHLEDRGVAPKLLKRINLTIQDIQSHGCLVNGPEAGLIDFPCIMGNEIVFLCWKFGEPRVEYWHRVSDGFAGRRPLLDREESLEKNSSIH